MSTKVNATWLSDKLILFLFVISMLLTKDIIIVDFPVYSLLLFLAAFGWMAAKVFLCPKDGQVFRPIRYWTDLMAHIAQHKAEQKKHLRILPDQLRRRSQPNRHCNKIRRHQPEADPVFRDTVSAGLF